MENTLRKKIEDKSANIGVVGLGYVGLPLAVEAAKQNFRTVGFDVNSGKVDLINCGKNYVADIENGELKRVVEEGLLKATCDYSQIGNMDFILICVPTPLDEHQQPDIRFVKEAVEAVATYLKKGAAVILESTTYPGTTEELLLPILENRTGYACGKDFYLGFSPERVDPGNQQYKTGNTPKVVGAIGEAATKIIALLYNNILASEIYTVTSPRVAEMEKLLENTYRNINIGLINELAILCDKMGIDIWEVIEAAKTKPYGFQAFYPGPGLGGHCIPLDPLYLSWKAKEFSIDLSMIGTSMNINNRMPEYCIERITGILNEQSKALRDARILVLGVAYKQDIDDYRESPAIRIIDLLEERGALVDFYDPYISEYMNKNKNKKGISGIDAKIIASYDAVVIATGHNNIDYTMIQKNAGVIFDMRNAMKNISNRNNIITL